MKKHSDNFWTAYPIGFYRIALLVLPQPFRREYAGEMELVFRDCCIEAYKSKGWPGALVETVRGMFDLLINAVKESSDRFFSDAGRQYAFLGVSSLAVCGGVFIANSIGSDGAPHPNFLACLFGFTLGCSRPKGFLLTGLIIGAMNPFVDLGLFAAVAGSVSGALFRRGLEYGAKRYA